MPSEVTLTGVKGYKQLCCDRENKVYTATSDDPLVQVCNECKLDNMAIMCIATMRKLDGERRLQVIKAFVSEV